MPKLRGNLANLKQFQRWQDLFALPGMAATRPAAPDRLHEVAAFGDNQGNLRMLAYAPPDLPAGAPLVVALHGCTQTAAGYDLGTGWSQLAERHRFALLLPEQRRANNPNTCFNWFVPDDIARDHGEAASIRAMIAHMVATHRLNPQRIFITGLSAGGAMTAVMLATYPEIFAGGAIIAGLPYACASTVHEALDCMFNGHPYPAQHLGDRARAASGHAGPWPTLSIWQGTADTTVHPTNAGELVKQWTNLHGLAATPDIADEIDGFPHRAWRNAAGETMIETHTITGMGHGVPLRTADPDGGTAGPYMLDVGIASTPAIALGWGLIPAAAKAPRTGAKPRPAIPLPELGQVISTALRKAGLLR